MTNKNVVKEQEARNYHHGNLRQALIENFIYLLRDTPRDKISMRKLATQIGVAPAAVYNHFENKEELEVAVKIKCLNHFSDHLNNADTTHNDPKIRIKNLGIAYFNYSREHPQYFNLIMSETSDTFPRSEELEKASMRAEEALRSSIIYLLESHALPSNQNIEALGAFACWSLSHGVTSLSTKKLNLAACAANRWPPILMMQSGEHIDTCFDAMSSILVSGIIDIAKRNDSVL